DLLQCRARGRMRVVQDRVEQQLGQRDPAQQRQPARQRLGRRRVPVLVGRCGRQLHGRRAEQLLELGGTRGRDDVVIRTEVEHLAAQRLQRRGGGEEERRRATAGRPR